MPNCSLKTDFNLSKYSLLSGCVAHSPLNNNLLNPISADHLFYGDITTRSLLPQMLFRLARTALLNKMHVAGPCPSSTLAGDGWLETSFSTGKTCMEWLWSEHQVGYVCACVSPFLVYSFVPTYDLLYVLPCVFRLPEFLNTHSALESAISCLIIVVLCRALPVPAGTRNKFPSTRLHAELLFPATALLCQRLPGEYMASTISLFSPHGLLILTVHLFFFFF